MMMDGMMDVKTVPGLPYWMGDDDDDGWNDGCEDSAGVTRYRGTVLDG